MSDPTLPELPEPCETVGAWNAEYDCWMDYKKPSEDYYTADQMRDYALAAIANTREGDGYRAAWDHLCANSYDHHTPHMICIPTDQWKEAEKLLPAAIDNAIKGQG